MCKVWEGKIASHCGVIKREVQGGSEYVGVLERAAAKPTSKYGMNLSTSNCKGGHLQLQLEEKGKLHRNARKAGAQWLN